MPIDMNEIQAGRYIAVGGTVAARGDGVTVKTAAGTPTNRRSAAIQSARAGKVVVAHSLPTSARVS